MQLREKRGERTQKELIRGLHKRGIEVDKPYLSKLERGQYLPTMELMRALCEEFKCEPLDIYEREEIDLLNAQKYPRASGRVRLSDRYRISARLQEGCCNSLKEALRNKGMTIQGWMERCALREVANYERRKNRAEARQGSTEVHNKITN